MSNLNDDESEAREEAYAHLDATKLAPPRERLALAIQTVRADPTFPYSSILRMHYRTNRPTTIPRAAPRKPMPSPVR